MIFIDNRQNKFDVTEELTKKLEEVISFVLKEEKVKEDCEVSLVFVDNEEIRGINNETRGIDRATDVLSFPMIDYPEDKVYKDVYLEHEFDKFKSLGAKKYMLHDTNSKKLWVACAGVPKKAQSILAKQGFNEFYLGKVIEGKLQSKQVKGGTLLTNIDFVIQNTTYVPH